MGKKEKNAEGKVEVQTEMLVNCHINKIYKCIFFFLAKPSGNLEKPSSSSFSDCQEGKVRDGLSLLIMTTHQKCI